MATAFVEERLTYLWETPKTIRGWFGTVDHKELGIRYLVTAFIFLLVGGIEALLVRIQLSRPDMAFLSPEAYNQIFTMHGVTMIFWYASPILSGFAIYLIPLMIGARDMAFPRLNAFTYWSFLLSGIHPGRTGFVFVLDRGTGELLSAEKFEPVNWASGYDLKTRLPQKDMAKQVHFGNYTRDICPSSTGGKEYVPSSFDPQTGYLYIPAHNTSMDYAGTAVNYIEGTPYLGASDRMYPGPGGYQGEFIAWDVKNARKVWSIKDPTLPVYSGVLSTGGGDRKSTRLNSSHPSISYAVFCLKKKKTSQYVL